MKRLGWLPVLMLLVVLAQGCGYTTKSSLDVRYKTVAVSPFYDKTKQYDLQAPLTNAVTRKFITDGRLKVVAQDDADLLLEGVITDYKMKGLTFDKKDNVTQYLMVVTAAVRLTDADTGKVLWEDPQFAGETSMYTRATGRGGDRLRGNAETFLPPVRSFTTAEENRAASEALEQLASGIFYRTVEPW